MFDSSTAGFDIFDDDYDYDRRPTATTDANNFILDIREYDVPYHVRVAIDKGASLLQLNGTTLTVFQMYELGSGTQSKQSMA